MFKKEITSILSFYAISPVHAGNGASIATVDLPIQRERHTGYPHIQASGVKGAMRAHFRNFNTNSDNELIQYIFGLDSQDGKVKSIDGGDKFKDALPGAISVSDAKLLAFPMRSNVAPFVWVTSPTIMKRLSEDLKYIELENNFNNSFEMDNDKAEVLTGTFTKGDKVLIEDAVVEIREGKSYQIDFIKNNFPDLNRLLLISDEMFDYCVSSCTEVQTNIKIDSQTGTAQAGALRYQEFLPADSVLYSIVYFSRKIDKFKAETIQNHLFKTVKNFIQIGGNETLGKGVCKINWINGVAK